MLARPNPCRVWLDDHGGTFCLVSEEDHAWALQWKWHFVFDKHRRKKYAARNTRLAGRAGPQTKIYMHKAILERSGLERPGPEYTIGEHGDGESLNNQRWNLTYTTPSGNRRTARRRR